MTDTVLLEIKWGKETIKFDFVVAGGVKGLKTELEEKTRVPSDRMKLMAKSKGLWKGVLKVNRLSVWHCHYPFLDFARSHGMTHLTF